MPPVALLPHVKRGIAGAHLATDLFDTRTQLGLLEGKCNLLLGELALLHDMLLPTWGLHHAGLRSLLDTIAAVQTNPFKSGMVARLQFYDSGEAVDEINGF